jgi:hypothetical protein
MAMTMIIRRLTANDRELPRPDYARASQGQPHKTIQNHTNYRSLAQLRAVFLIDFF